MDLRRAIAQSRTFHVLYLLQNELEPKTLLICALDAAQEKFYVEAEPEPDSPLFSVYCTRISALTAKEFCNS